MTNVSTRSPFYCLQNGNVEYFIVLDEFLFKTIGAQRAVIILNRCEWESLFWGWVVISTSAYRVALLLKYCGKVYYILVLTVNSMTLLILSYNCIDVETFARLKGLSQM